MGRPVHFTAPGAQPHVASPDHYRAGHSWLRWTPIPATAQDADSTTLTLDRIFNSDYLSGDFAPPIRWTPDGQAYYSYDRRPEAKGPDLARVNPVTGEKTVLVRSEQLTPAGDTVPLRMAELPVL